MKRFISISMVLVVAGWLMFSALAANALSCSMRCCRRVTKHIHCEEMTIPGSTSGQPEIGNIAKACRGGCFLKGPSGQAGLPSPLVASDIFHSRAPKSSPLAPEGAEPKFLTHAGRAPPLCMNQA